MLWLSAQACHVQLAAVPTPTVTTAAAWDWMVLLTEQWQL
jgi:hypothetical protein